METNILLFFIYKYFEMKTSFSERKKKIEKIRKEKIILFNKVNNLNSNGANVYVIIKYNNKYSIYNSRFDKEWPSSKVILISDIIFCWRDVLNLSRDSVHLARLLPHQFYLCATSSIIFILFSEKIH
jgi:hypothetical protein